MTAVEVGGDVQGVEGDGERERKEEDRYLYMLSLAGNSMPEMGGGGPSERFALGVAHFFFPVSCATIFSP